MTAPVSDAEQLVWNVLEAEHPAISQLHEKSLVEANLSFLSKNEDSLMHRAAVAEMMYLLEPNKKAEAVKLIENSSSDMVSINGSPTSAQNRKLNDAIAVHKLLENVLADKDAASRWKAQCAEYFPHSTYFEGSQSSAVSKSYLSMLAHISENGTSNHPDFTSSAILNGKLANLKI